MEREVFKPTTLRAYALRAEEAGYDPESLFLGSEATWQDIDQLKAMSLSAMGDPLDHLARHTSPDFPIECGNNCELSHYGVVGFAVQSMPTLRDAFTCWARYGLLAGFPLIGTITETETEWIYEFKPRFAMTHNARRLCVEISIAALEAVIRELSGKPATTNRIDFAFERTASDQAIALLGTREIHYRQETSRYFGDVRDLDRAVRSHSDEVSSLFSHKCDRHLMELTGALTMSERIEEMLALSVGRVPSIAETARQLRTGPRTIQRQLSEEGKTYLGVVRDFRLRHAKLLLGDARYNVKTVAHLLGFCDASSLRRAFREWTGQTIGGWQASCRDMEIMHRPRGRTGTAVAGQSIGL